MIRNETVTRNGNRAVVQTWNRKNDWTVRTFINAAGIPDAELIGHPGAILVDRKEYARGTAASRYADKMLAE